MASALRQFLASRARIAWIALALACVAAAALSAAPAAFAGDAPSAIDQYLEVVPGPEGDQSPEEFSRSLGGDGGPVTREQVLREARKNAELRALEAAESNRLEFRSVEYDEEAPGTIAAFTNAATGGSLGGGLTVPLLLIIALTATLGLVTRRRRSVRQPPTGE